MALLPLVIYPDPRLKTRSSPVATVTEEIRALAQDMFETMYHERGIGLAAVQVGEMKRMLVADVEWDEDGVPGEQWVLINPEIIESSAEPHVHKEGCLSFPDQSAEVERPAGVRVRFQDLSGEWQEREFTGLLATCVQHEIDHINGIVFPDRVKNRMKRDMLLRKAKKIKQEWEDHHHHGHVHGPDCNH